MTMRYPAGEASASPSGLAYVALVTLNLVGPVCVLLWFMTAPEPLATTLALVGLLFILCLQPPLAQLAAGSWDPFHVLNVFCFAYLMYFPVKAVLLIFYFAEVDSYDQLNAALAYAIVGLLALYVGYTSKLGGLLHRAVPKFPEEWHAGRPQKAALLYLVVGALSGAVIIQSVGGFAYYLTHLELRGFFFEGKGYLLWGMQLVCVAVPLYFCALVSGRGRRLSVAFYAYLVAALIVQMLTGGRSNTIAMIVTIFIAARYLRRAFSWHMFCLAGAAAVVLFIVSAKDRLSLDKAAFEPLDYKLSVDRSLGDDLSALDPFVRILSAIPGETPFQDGRTLFHLLIYPVPRLLWPGKPKVLGANGVYSATFEPTALRSGAVSGASILGELYMNFGAAGIVFGMFLYGVVCRTLYSQVNRSLPSKNGVLVYVTSLYAVILGIRGGFWALVPALLTSLFSVWITLAYVSKERSVPLRVRFVRHQLPLPVSGADAEN